MAIREQRDRQRPFFVYWTNPFTGKRESKSCATRVEAEKLDAYIKYQLKHEREAFRRLEASVQEQPRSQTLESAMYLYLKERKLAKENLKKLLMAARATLEQYGNTPLESVDKGLLQKIQGGFVAQGNSGATVKRKMGIIRAVVNWAHRAGMVESVPLFPQLPKVQHVRYVPLTPEEIATLYQVSPEHLRRVIILGYYVGMRVGTSELLKLQWQDVDLAGGFIRVPNAAKGKSDPWREVPIVPQIMPLLFQWQEADVAAGIAIVVHYAGKPVRSIKTAWKARLAPCWHNAAHPPL